MRFTSIRLVLALGALLGAPADGLAQARMGSIYDASRGPVGLLANKTARRVGDLLTIIISETQDLKNEEKTDLKKATDLDYQLLNFDISPDTFNTLPALVAESTDTFTGTANYEKKGKFSARLTAVVMDTLPGGNLVVKGRREIRIDGEVKTIEFSGIVRRYDVLPNNTVESELVANARVSYVGAGPLTKSTNRYGLGGWFHDAIAWLWPF
ncbi:MAG: flagellar basal body L-ring protein FlgH [Planctomycetota bacterium]|nr:MAG: flagellar basal body L-ring protein FlgH [Planctomycetota bacterium]